MAYPASAAVVESRVWSSTKEVPMGKKFREQKPRCGRKKKQGEVTLKFFPNKPRPLSYFEGQPVFLDKHLARMLFAHIGEPRQVSKVSIKTFLQKGWDRDSRRHCWIADNRYLRFVRPNLPFDKCQKPRVIVDGANLFITLRKIRKAGIGLTAAQAIETVIGGLARPEVVELKLCEGDLEAFAEEISGLQHSFNGRLDIRLAGIEGTGANRCRKQKRLDDKLVAQRLYDLVNDDEGSQLIILFSGDQYFLWPARRWLQSKHNGENGRTHQLIIVSSRIPNGDSDGFVSPKLLELTNHQNALFVGLEELAGSTGKRNTASI